MGDFYFNRVKQPKQPPKSGYGFLATVVKGVISRAGTLIEILDASHQHGGNPGYPADAMLSACIMQFALGERYANAFLNTLDSNARLLAICGLPWAPSERAYSQFKKHKLAHHQDLIRFIIVDLFLECGVEIERLRALGLVPADKPPLGEALVMDSTDVEAWARPGRKSRKTGEEIPSKDSDAKWGHRTAKNARSYKARSGQRRSVKKDKGKKGTAGQKESKDELYLGYKVNVIVDANHGLPLFAETRPANASDVAVMIQDLDDCLALYRTLSPQYFLGDKGYDSLKNILHVISLGMIPVIAIRLPEKDPETGQRLYDSAYVEDGRPLCACGCPMEYIETDPEQGHLFQCAPDGCSPEDNDGVKVHCNEQRYVKPEGRLLRIVGLLPRCSDEWTIEYKKRPIIERYFSSDKHSRLMDQHRYFNIFQMSLHVALSMLTYLATVLAHLQADDYAHMRHMRIRLPRAEGASRRGRMSPTPACRDPGCGCCARWRDAA